MKNQAAQTIPAELTTDPAVAAFEINGDRVRVFLAVGFWKGERTSFTCALNRVAAVLEDDVFEIEQ